MKARLLFFPYAAIYLVFSHSGVIVVKDFYLHISCMNIDSDAVA